MKTKTINLYSFSELSQGAKEKAIHEHIDFEIDMMDKDSPYYDFALEMEHMQTPLFLHETIYVNAKQSIIDTIEANDYYFDENGNLTKE